MKRILIILLFVIANFSNGQSILYSSDLTELCKISNTDFVYNKIVAKENKNPVQLLFSTLYLCYKNYFSSQDYSHCAFHPSCSEYALLSIKKYGFFVAIMAASDRLLRCNGLNSDNYEFDDDRNLLIDIP